VIHLKHKNKKQMVTTLNLASADNKTSSNWSSNGEFSSMTRSSRPGVISGFAKKYFKDFKTRGPAVALK
jgi:hypothetical protein